MIFHLLIVDDEAATRKGLSCFIDWESIDCTVTATACDGADAIRKIESSPVDIVITDIKMPEIDGLGLARYIYENHPQIAVILLTGYAEFEYARTAIRYNVSSFLLKPTPKNEIIDAVKQAQQKIIISKRQDSIAKNELAFLKDQFLQDLTCGYAGEDTQKRLEQFKISLDNYYIAAFRLDESPAEIHQLKELIIHQKTNSYCFRYNNLILSVYFENDPAPVIENCQEIIRIPGQLYSMKVSVGISRLHHGAEEFSAAAYEAIHTLSLAFYSASSVSVFDRQNDQPEYILSAEDTLSLYELENAIRRRDFSSAASITNALFLKLKSNLVNEADAKNICSHIYFLTFRVLAKYGLTLPREDFLTMISRSGDIFQLEDIVGQLLAFTKKELTASRRKYSQSVQDAITYIQEHLAENLTLEEIARFAHMNSSYLSRIFKKECGCSLTEHITAARMEKAKEFLADTNLLTYEIAERIGINDSSYFSLLFRKYSGLTPTEYRNRFR